MFGDTRGYRELLRGLRDEVTKGFRSVRKWQGSVETEGEDGTRGMGRIEGRAGAAICMIIALVDRDCLREGLGGRRKAWRPGVGPYLHRENALETPGGKG